MKKYISPTGTASRSEYWALIVFYLTANLIGFFLWQLISYEIIMLGYDVHTVRNIFYINNIIFILLAVTIFWIHATAVVRRLLDAGRSVLWILMTFPLYAFAALIVALTKSALFPLPLLLAIISCISYIVIGVLPRTRSKEKMS